MQRARLPPAASFRGLLLTLSPFGDSRLDSCPRLIAIMSHLLVCPKPHSWVRVSHFHRKKLTLGAKERWMERERPMSPTLRSSDSQTQFSSHDLELLPSFASSWASQSPCDSPEPYPAFLSPRDGRETSESPREGGAGDASRFA